MKTNLARIFVKNTFCINCVNPIKKKIGEVNNIKNVALYPSESLVVFNFNSANQVSEVLNTLMTLGYPPEVDCITTMNLATPLCTCAVQV